MESRRATRNVISALWAYVALNIAFADILALYTPGVLPAIMGGTVEGVALSQALMLVAALILQIPLSMIVAAQVLPPRLWRAANGTAIGLTALFVIGGGSLKPHYIFLASCEMIALLAIALLVWRYAPEKG